ncbi:unnamed protein product, partial [Hapterophycus canaliculatus]
QPLPEIKKLSDRQDAARQHAGLCGYHHANCIGEVDFQAIIDRSGRADISNKRLRNQVCYDTGIGLNARGRGVQLKRGECFTQACRAVWPGDDPVPAAIAEALLL